METLSALLAICAGNSPIPGEFPAQNPVTRSFHVFLDLRLNKRLNKQSWGWWFETLSRLLWRHYDEYKHTGSFRGNVCENVVYEISVLFCLASMRFVHMFGVYTYRMLNYYDDHSYGVLIKSLTFGLVFWLLLIYAYHEKCCSLTNCCNLTATANSKTFIL